MCGSRDAVTPQQHEAIRRFTELVKCDSMISKFWLRKADWSIDKALVLYFRRREGSPPSDFSASPASTSASRLPKNAGSANSVSPARSFAFPTESHLRSVPRNPPSRPNAVAREFESLNDAPSECSQRFDVEEDDDSSSLSSDETNLAPFPSLGARAESAKGTSHWGVKSAVPKRPFHRVPYQLKLKECLTKNRPQCEVNSAPKIPQLRTLNTGGNVWTKPNCEVVELVDDEDCEVQDGQLDLKSRTLSSPPSSSSSSSSSSPPPQESDSASEEVILCNILPPTHVQLSDGFSFFLGSFEASGSFTSVQKIVLSAKLSLVIQTPLPQAVSRQAPSGGRRSKAAKTNPRLLFVDLEDPLLKYFQRRLLCSTEEAESQARASHVLQKKTNGSASPSALEGVDFLHLLSNISEQNTVLRLKVGDHEAVRFDRSVTRALAALLLVGAARVEPSWVGKALPPRQPSINCAAKVHLAVFVTSNALRLSVQKQSKKGLLSQLDLSTLLGQSWSQLTELLSLKRVDTSETSNGLSSESAERLASDALLSKRLQAIRSAGALRRGRPATPPRESPVGSPKKQRPSISPIAEPPTQTLDADGALSLVGDEEDEEPAMEEEAFEDEDDNSQALAEIVLGKVEEEEKATERPSRRSLEARKLGRIFPPRQVFKSQLRDYQAKGVWWMVRCETDRARALSEEEDALDPLWAKFKLSRKSNAKPPQRLPFRPKFVYFNFTAGLVSLERPLFTGRVRGGVLADSMGLGKTVQVLALIAWNIFVNCAPKQAQRLLENENRAGKGSVSAKLEASAAAEERDTSLFQSSSQNADENPRRDNSTLPSVDSNESAVEKMNSKDDGVTAKRQALHVQQEGDAEALSLGPSLRMSGRSSDCMRLDCEWKEVELAELEERLKAPDPRVLASQLRSDSEGRFPGGTLLVVPLAVLDQWRLEAERHLAQGVASVAVYYGSSRSRDAQFLAAHTIVLTTYSTLAHDFKTAVSAQSRLKMRETNAESVSSAVRDSPLAAIHFRRVVLDEGHIIKNTQALINKACNLLSAETRWVLTGTPLQNELSDAFALLQFLRVSPMGCKRWWKENVTAAEERGSLVTLRVFLPDESFCLIGERNTSRAERPLRAGMVADAVRTVRKCLIPLMLRRQGSDLDEQGKPLLPLPKLTIHTFTLQLTCGERLFYQACLSCRQLLTQSLESPTVRKLLSDLREGRLEKCPVCLDELFHPVALTTCWHTLCLTCVIILQDESKDACCFCPVCRTKFLRQNVVHLPPFATSPQGESWRHVVLKRHLKEQSLQRQRRSGCESSSLIGGSVSSAKNASPSSPEAFLLPEAKALDEAELDAAKQDAVFFSTKIRVLLALVEADVKAGRSCVVFSQWKMMLDLVEQAMEHREALRSQADFRKSQEEKGVPPESTCSSKGGAAKKSADPSLSSSRVFYHRRVDGSLSLEARQRAIEWFVESTAADEHLVKTEDATSDEEEISEDAFMGVFPWGPFAPCVSSNDSVTSTLQTTAGKTRNRNASTPPGAVPPGHLGKVLLFSLKTGCVGLNLTAASRGYILDNWWNPQVEKQAMRRLWRFGQEKPVEIFRFVCARTVEERIEELLKYKGWLSDCCLEESTLARESSGDEEERRKGTLSLKDLKKLFEGWELEEQDAVS